MGTYSDWEQRQMDIESGEELDRHASSLRPIPARRLVGSAQLEPCSHCGTETLYACWTCKRPLCTGCVRAGCPYCDEVQS